MKKNYVFPYKITYLWPCTGFSDLHEWTQIQIEKLETFRRNCLGIEIPLSADAGKEIICANQKQLDFFREHRIKIRELLRESGMNAETTSRNITDHNGDKWTVETIGFAGHFRLWAKLKHTR